MVHMPMSHNLLLRLELTTKLNIAQALDRSVAHVLSYLRRK